MPLDLRAILTTVAALLSGILAALALTNPVLRDWAIVASPSEVDRWISSGPTAVGLGAVVAVLACALSQRRGSRRAAWIAITVGVAVIAIIRAVVPEVASLDLLIAVIIVKSVAAGAILGCVVAVSWDRTATKNATLLGVLATFLAVRTFSGGTGRMSTSSVGEPSWWLIGATAAAAIACAVTAQSGFRIRKPDAGEIRIALVVIAALAIGHRVLGAVIDRQQYASEATAWMVMVLAAGAALALTWIAAYRLGDTSGAGGKFLWAATALAAASAPLFVDIAKGSGHWGPLKSPWVLVLFAALPVAVGLRLHKQVPNLVPIAVLVAVPLSELLPFDSAHGVWSIALKIAALGLAAGLLFGALAPGSLVDATLGLAIPFAAMTFSSIAILTDQLTAPPELTAADIQRLMELPVPAHVSADGGLFGRGIGITIDYVTPQTVGTAILFALIIGFCGAAILRRSHPPVDTTESRIEPEPVD